jgi:two-component system OmpR family sensor kinase
VQFAKRWSSLPEPRKFPGSGYVQPRDTVVVEVSRTAHGPTISVSDNGPGVPADQRERIFEPFVRLPRGPRGGTGLGLAIVRRTIESHSGTITCEPSPIGGARFTLRLPPKP